MKKQKKKFSKGKLALYLGFLCVMLFMSPLYMLIFFSVDISKELLALSIAPGFTGVALLVCSNYIINLEAELQSRVKTYKKY